MIDTSYYRLSNIFIKYKIQDRLQVIIYPYILLIKYVFQQNHIIIEI